MLNVAFCDDNYVFLCNVREKAKEIFEAFKIRVSIDLFTDADLLIEKSELYGLYDVVFLDIYMPLSGLEVARKLRLLDHQFKLIFITAFEEEVWDAFQFKPSGFLPKGELERRLGPIIQQVVNDINEEDVKNQLFSIKKENGGICEIKVPLNNIKYFESVSRQVFMYTTKGGYLLHGYKFAELVDQYSDDGFVDIHRTCTVNIQYVCLVNDKDVILDDGKMLPLSRRKRQAVIQKLIREVTIC